MMCNAFGRFTLMLVCVSATLALTGCGSDEVAGERAKVDIIPVKAVAVVQQEVQRTTTQPATIYPYFRAEIRAQVTGYLKELKADIGDYVQTGAVLAVIDVPEMEKQRQVKRAKIRRGEADEMRATAGVELAEAQVQSAQAKLAQAKSESSRVEAMLAAVEAEFKRVSDLVERRSLEGRMLDEVRKKRDAELASRDAVLSAIQSSEADVVVARAQQAAAEADLLAAKSETDIARSELDELEVLVEFATLKAPFDGIVSERNIDPGDLVRREHQPMTGPLFVVSQIDKVRIHVHLPEAEAALVSQGDGISLRLPSFTGEQAMQTTVARVSGTLDPSTRTMLVEAEMKNPDQKLLPGMFGQASIALASKVAANMLSARAVRFDESGQAFVYVVDGDETVSIVNVATGIDDGKSIEILSGVEAGQKVVDAHLKRFVSGQRVRLLTN